MNLCKFILITDKIINDINTKHIYARKPIYIVTVHVQTTQFLKAGIQISYKMRV